MKNLYRILLAGLCAGLILTACNDDEGGTSFGPATERIEIGPEGGTETFTLYADGPWTASVNNDWIKITPTNGLRTTDITIRVDSTLNNNMRSDVIQFIQPGVIRDVTVTQAGFGKEIVVLDETQKSISLPDYEIKTKANFYIDVTSNVSYTVSTGVSWLTARTRTVPAAAKAKPRTTRLYFDYDSNIGEMEQFTQITFTPVDDEPEEVKADNVEVKQDGAAVIEPSRHGDSLVIRTLLRLMDGGLAAGGFPENLSMDYWDNVELHDNGRVKRLRFYMIEHHTLFPYHIKYLDELEILDVWGGIGVTASTPSSLGPEIAELKNLKGLYLEALSIDEIDPALYTMDHLESLSLASNNLYEIPDEINPVNFPNLKHLYLNSNTRYHVYDLSNSKYDISEIGLHGEFPRRMLEWEALETLTLNANYFEGEIPDMLDYSAKWERGLNEEWDEILDDRPDLIGTPRVLPNCKDLRININRLTGDIPDWVLDHPNLCKWNPYTFIFTQEGTDSNGIPAKFENVPDKLDCNADIIED